MTFYYKKINDFIKQFDPETLAVLNNISVTKSYKKSAYLLREGEICRRSYWIVSGTARKYYLNNGKEITTALLFENDIAVSFESYCVQKPGTEFIQAITGVTASVTDHTTFEAAKKEHQKLAALDLMMTEYYAIWLEDRLLQLHTMDATQRYNQLLEKDPHIIQQIPLTYIASYLNVSLETLSRIRAKING